MWLRLCTTLVALIILGSTAAPARGQYIKLQTDNPASNVRLKPAGTTLLTVILDTDHNRNGSLQSCNSMTASAACLSTPLGEPLDLFSYQFTLNAIGGTVQWGTFSPATSAYSQDFSP